MKTTNRRAFLGAAGLGAVAATIGSAEGSSRYGGNYNVFVRPSAVVGLGSQDAASLSIVWMPGPSRQPPAPLKVCLMLYDLGGKVLAEKEALLTPFSGASVDHQPAQGGKRQQVFGYVEIDGLTDKIAEELFAGVEVYDVVTGRMNIAAGVPALG